MNDYRALKLLEAFAECARHSRRMLNAYNKVLPIFPLDVNKYRILTDDEIKTINSIVLSLRNYFDLHVRKRINDKLILQFEL